MSDTKEETISSKQARAKRLKKLRKMCGLTRKDFSEKFMISASNFQNWEGPRYGGLTEAAAIKCINCFRQEGIISSLEWLMYGSGPAPSILSTAFSVSSKDIPSTQSTPTIYSLPNHIQTELKHFQTNHPNSLSYILEDDSMQPYFQPGEVVAGICYLPHQLISTTHQDCIIVLNTGQTLLRHLVADQYSNQYNLVAHNLKSRVNDLICYQSNVLKASPVIWRRVINT